RTLGAGSAQRSPYGQSQTLFPGLSVWSDANATTTISPNRIDAIIDSPPDVDGMAGPGRHQLELGVAERAHLGQVEPLELRVRADALTDEDVDEPVQNVGQREDDAHQRTHADQLGDELARIAVEQT